MSVTVYLKNLRVAPRKVRLVVDLIRGMDVSDALNQLNYMPKRSAGSIAKLLQSGIATAEHDFKMKKQELYIAGAIVQEGQTLKRTMPRAMGRAFRIAKKTSHIMIALDQKEKERILDEENKQVLNNEQ